MSLYLGTNLISGVATPIEGARNIGQIVQSTIPLTDVGLHLLDGALISGSGSYADFVTYIAGLVSSYPDIFTTEANWQTAVTTYGVCGKFVYDSVNQTVRLPKYNSKIYTGGGTASVAGNGKGLGLTDGTTTGCFGNYNAGYNASYYNATLGSDVGSSYSPIAPAGTKVIGVVTDGSKSGLIAQLSNITTSVDGYYYIVIATSTKTDIEVDIDEIATDLNGKADVDLSNINPSASTKATIVNWSMPDYSAGVSVGLLPYTAPSDGYLKTHFTFNSGDIALYVNGEILQIAGGGAVAGMDYMIPVRKNDYITRNSTGANAYINNIFYPCKGV